MTQDNYSGSPQGRPPEGDSRRSHPEQSLRGPLLLFFVSAILWLLVSSVLGLFTAFDLQFLLGVGQGCEILTYGHLVPAQKNLFIYGWCFNAFFALNLWLLSQLGRFEFRNAWLATLGGLVWNAALTYGIVRLFAGEMNSFSLLEMSGGVGLVLALGFLLAGFWPIVAFARRPTENSFVSQWFVVGATFIFPVIYLLTQWLVYWMPASGTVQALVHSWFVQNVLWLWLGGSALALVYYFLSKVLSQAISNYPLASVAFWTLFLFAGWSAPAALLGSPLPLWVQSTGVVGAVMMFIPILVTGLNFYGTLSTAGGWARAWNSTTLRFIVFGAVAFTAAGILNVVFSTRGLNGLIRFTAFGAGQELLLTYAFVTMVIFGATYFILPRLTGNLWPSAKLVHLHFWATAAAALGSAATALIQGWQTGKSLADASVTSAQLVQSEKDWAIYGTIFAALFLVGHLAFALNAFGMILKSKAPATPGQFD